jgi:hypothetical protein
MLSRLQRSWPPSRDCTRADHTAWLCSAIAKLIRSTRAPIEDRLIGKIMGGDRLLCGTRVPVAGNRRRMPRSGVSRRPAAALPLYARLPAASPRHRPPAMKRIFAQGTAQLQLSNQSPTICQLGMSLIRAQAGAQRRLGSRFFIPDRPTVIGANAASEHAASGS